MSRTALWNPSTEEWDIQLPTKKEVCPRCNGTGTHDAWDGGMTAQEMDEQGPEFFEDYMNGMYSVICTTCHGTNVIDVVDETRADKELLKQYHAQQQEEADYQAECAAERAMGA